MSKLISSGREAKEEWSIQSPYPGSPSVEIVKIQKLDVHLGHTVCSVLYCYLMLIQHPILNCMQEEWYIKMKLI